MQTYLVGGAVRDELLGRNVTERDWVVVGATPAELKAQGFTQVGKDFPVFLHPKTKEEYALARTERKSGRGYTGFVCDASPTVTLEDDLLRRDLTVNAMARRQDGTIVDPFDGLADLKARYLRHVSDAFSEDPLRVFRVARFAARYAHLGFRVHQDTVALMQRMADSGELTALTAERVWQETRRSLMEQDPVVFFEVLAEAHALTDWFTELPPPPHPCFENLRQAVTANLALEQRIAVLCAPLAEDKAATLCTRLKAPNVVCDLVRLTTTCGEALICAELDADTMLTLFDQVDAWRKPERFDALLDVCRCLNSDKATFDLRRQQLKLALEAALSVDAKAIAASGIRGPEIRDAIRAARYAAIVQSQA